MSAHLAIFEDSDLALQQLGDSGVTNGFVVDKLIAGWEEFRKTSENAKIKSMNYEKGSVCKKNNSRVVFTFSNGKTLNVAVNIPLIFSLQLPQNVDKKEMNEHGMKMHNNQVKFLELFGGIDGVLPMPKIYYIGKCGDFTSQEKPIILMEDLLPIDNCALPFNEMEVKSIIIELANFHVHLWSVDNGWKDTIEKFPNSGKEGIFKQIEMFEEKKFEKFGELTINWKSVKQFIEKALKAEEYAKLPDVLILNLNPNTLVFSGNPLRLTLTDFQVWVGPMLYNLVKVCMLSQWWSTSNTTERREREMEMLSLYYDQIMEKSNNQCCGFELSLDGLKNAYRFQKFLAAIEALIPCLTAMNLPSHIQMPEETKKKFLDGYIQNQESFIMDAMEILNEY